MFLQQFVRYFYDVNSLNYVIDTRIKHLFLVEFLFTSEVRVKNSICVLKHQIKSKLNQKVNKYCHRHSLTFMQILNDNIFELN